jgi:hypothetical protein
VWLASGGTARFFFICSTWCALQRLYFYFYLYILPPFQIISHFEFFFGSFILLCI